MIRFAAVLDAADCDHMKWEQSAVMQELDDFCKKSKSEAEKEQKKVSKLVWLSSVIQSMFV